MNQLTKNQSTKMTFFAKLRGSAFKQFIDLLFINRLLKSFSLLVLGLVISLSAAANQPFYFIAKQAPEGSLTGISGQNSVVYLRWDLLEGDLPTDISGFNLYRDNSLIGQFPANQIATAQQITQLYQSSSQARRLIETMALLKEESVLDPNVQAFNVNDYGAAIYDRLGADNYWAQLASRRDFNIAIARNRATIDRPGVGVFVYELKAFNSISEERRVGLVSVDTQQTQVLLPIPDFTQLNLSQCDVPDIKDHYSVALNWVAAGGTNMADTVANQLFVSGYDLYRSKQNVAANVLDAPIRDLAKEAAALSYDNKGQIAFTDLERVNDTLITVSPDMDLNNPEWLETQAELSNAGIKPGDRRAYYLVARDFTGNFGPTIGTIVTVGDMSRPPAPWDIDVYLSEENQRVELSFEEINQEAWLESFGLDKRVCSIDDNGALSFVGRSESCAENRHRLIQTEVESYLLYRFDNFADASSFRDSDGDGFSNKSERPSNTQCIASPNIGDALIESEFVVEQLSDHARVRVSDKQPANQKGDIYWYRLAAKGINGRLSFLSEPIRVNFPDRTLPDAPSLDLTYPGDGSQACGCEIDYQQDNTPWSFSAAPELGNNLTFSCNGNNYSVDPKNLNKAKTGSCSTGNGNNLVADCQLGGQITTNNNGLNCAANIDQDVDFCGSGSFALKTTSCDEVPAPEGIIEGPLTITATATQADHCVSIYQQIAGEEIKVSTSCGNDQSQDLVHVVERGEFCGYAVTHDANNNISVSNRVACRQVIDSNSSDKPLSPRINTLNLDQAFASVDIALPTQSQTVIEVELVQTAPTKGDVIVSRNGIASATETNTIINFDIPQLTGANDQWCVRARVHSASERVGEPRVSSWTAQKCMVRSSSNLTEPQWLSWPGLSTANQGQDLTARVNTDFGVVPSSSPISSGIHIPLLETQTVCNRNPNTQTLFGEIAQDAFTQGAGLLNLVCREANKIDVVANYLPSLNFIVFRQTRQNNVVSNFKQISPLIDYVHWVDAGSDKDIPLFRLKDPYIWVAASAIDANDTITMNYVDRAPLLPDMEYRYQFVYFDANHKLVEWRQTQWLLFTEATTESAIQIVGGAQ